MTVSCVPCERLFEIRRLILNLPNHLFDWDSIQLAVFKEGFLKSVGIFPRKLDETTQLISAGIYDNAATSTLASSRFCRALSNDTAGYFPNDNRLFLPFNRYLKRNSLEPFGGTETNRPSKSPTL